MVSYYTGISEVDVNVCFVFKSYLNGLYTPSGDQRSGIQWRSFTAGGFEALSFSEMKLRWRI